MEVVKADGLCSRLEAENYILEIFSVISSFSAFVLSVHSWTRLGIEMFSLRGLNVTWKSCLVMKRITFVAQLDVLNFKTQSAKFR